MINSRSLKSLFFILLLLGFNSILYSQCLPYSGTILPEADTSVFNLFGSSIAIYDDVMIVGTSNHDSLEYGSGLAYVYYKNSIGQWDKKFTLSPSKGQPNMGFGHKIVMTKNTIVIGLSAGFYKDEETFGRLYIYQKNDNETWKSGSESYYITLPHFSFISDFDLSEEYLTLGGIYTENFSIFNRFVNIYKKDNKRFELISQIDPPYLDYNGQSNFGQNVSISDDLIAITDTDYFYNDKRGVALVYERNNNSWNLKPSAYLTYSDNEIDIANGFAANIDIDNSNVFVGVAAYSVSTTNYTLATFVYNKPNDGWSDKFEDVKLIVDKDISKDIYQSTRDLKVKAIGNYLILNNFRVNNEIYVFKNNASSWQNQVERATFRSYFSEGGRWFGYNFALNSDDFIISSPVSSTGNGHNDLIYHYDISSTKLEDKLEPDYVIKDIYISGSGDQFGNDISINKKSLIVGSVSDDNNGLFTGAAYVFEFADFEWNQAKIIYSPTPRPFDNFGRSVEMIDDFLFIGAPLADSVGGDGEISILNIGKVFVYEKINSEWQYSSTIISPDVIKQAEFGSEISCNNGILAVGEYNYNGSGNSGKVHLYKLNKNNIWESKATLTPSVPTFGFGISIALNDSLVVIGSYGGFSGNYRVHIYSKNGSWISTTESAVLSNTEYYSDSGFGYDIDLYGDNIVVGAPRDNRGEIGNFYGKAYVYQKPETGWSGVVNEIAQLEPKSPQIHNQFGYSISLEPHMIKVGAPHSIVDYNRVGAENNSLKDVQSGKVYIFLKKGITWQSANEDKIIISPDPEPLDGYGFSIDSQNGHFLVGSLLDDTEVGMRSGAVHTYYDLPFILTSDTVLCPYSDLVELKGFPKGGTFIGKGVDGDFFNPALAGSGVHVLNYQIEDCTNLPFLKIRVINELEAIEIAFDSLYICQGEDSVELEYNYSSINTSVQWSFSEDNNSFTDLLATVGGSFYAKNKGFYKAKVSNSCYYFEDQTEVKTESISIPEDFDVCSDLNEIQLTDYIPTDGVWNGDLIDENATIDLSKLQKGNHIYEYNVDRLNCVFSDSLVINVHSIPEIIFEKDTSNHTICEIDDFEIKAINLDESWVINWEYSNDSIFFSSLFEETMKKLKPEQQGFYRLMVTDGYCDVFSSTVKIDYYSNGSIKIPNAFTPNNDGFNDTFKFEYEDITLRELRIYNRDGVQVFLSYDILNEWSGLNEPAGVYYYYINYYSTCNPSKSSKLKGIIHLLR